MPRTWLLLSIAAVSAGCRDRVQPPAPIPADLEIVANLPSNGIAGSAAGDLVVRVTDAAGRPLSGVLVNFAPTIGAGRVIPVADTTRADGTASTSLTLGTVPGSNEVAAVVAGLPPVKSAIVSGAAGAVATVTAGPR